MSRIKHIAVSGNIGSGKTTLVEKLSKHYGWTPLYESVDNNPYLRDFYDDMKRWAFHLQIYFLNSRFNQVRQIRDNERTIIQDRTIYEDAYIFASNLHASGFINDRDYQSYLDIFHSMINFVQPPDLLLYRPQERRCWFAEVKGPGDSVSDGQRASWPALTARFGTTVEVVNVVLSADAG